MPSFKFYLMRICEIKVARDYEKYVYADVAAREVRGPRMENDHN